MSRAMDGPDEISVNAPRSPGNEPPRLWLGNSNLIATVWLVGSLLCVVLALCMSVGTNRQVYFLSLPQPIPETCFTYNRFGIDCPGCGLTRTFIHLTHAQFAEAWRLNPVGWMVFLFVCIQIPFGFAQVVLGMRGRWVEAWGIWNDWATAVLIGALVLQWFVRVVERLLT